MVFNSRFSTILYRYGKGLSFISGTWYLLVHAVLSKEPVQAIKTLKSVKRDTTTIIRIRRKIKRIFCNLQEAAHQNKFKLWHKIRRKWGGKAVNINNPSLINLNWCLSCFFPDAANSHWEIFFSTAKKSWSKIPSMVHEMMMYSVGQYIIKQCKIFIASNEWRNESQWQWQLRSSEPSRMVVLR